MKNKKGEKLISIYWFVILTLVAGGVVIMVNSFYSSPYDVRDVEADILSMKVADCVYYGGEMNSDLISDGGVFKPEFKDNFMDHCSLNFDVVGEFDRPDYYLEMHFYYGGDLKRDSFSIIEGNLNLKADCSLEEVGSGRVAKCSSKSFYAVDNSEHIYLVKVLSVVNKVDENVK